ncbi:MAG TPA: class I SAM-dependent methyltransferase [Candidatus Polarisedimenticolia bacterium]|nr:class I SAM-dependent methyltransferase [Candidatus Polarisedimenticolia bacterium]
MTDVNVVFTGSIPENYDRYLGPTLFEPYARDLARRVPGKHGTRLLEVACGTGIATRHLLDHLPPGGRLVATDLNEPMLQRARGSLPAAGRIDWRQADACALPFEDGSFDAVVCQFGLMFVPDKGLAVREARRVLAPGGAFVTSVWDSLDANRFARIAHETIASYFPSDPPTFYQVPFSLHDRQALLGLLAANGFPGARLEEVALEGESPSAADLARGLVEGNPVGAAVRERGGVPVETVIGAVARNVAKEFGDRPVRLPLKAVVASARAGAPAPARD